jgi:hypothetical protein
MCRYRFAQRFGILTPQKHRRVFIFSSFLLFVLPSHHGIRHAYSHSLHVVSTAYSRLFTLLSILKIARPIPIFSRNVFFLRIHRALGVRGLSTAAALATSKAASIKTVAVPGLKNGMDYARLGDSDLVVSKVCMGTMTFGEVRYVTLHMI